MGVHSYGDVSTSIKRLIDLWSTAEIERFGYELLKPSEIPEYADRDWWKQAIIDWFAKQAGEKP